MIYMIYWSPTSVGSCWIPGARDHGVDQHGADCGRSFHGKSGALGESRGVDGWFLLEQVVLKNVRSKLLKFTLGIW